MEFNYEDWDYGLSTGIYDATSMTLLNVAIAVGDPDGIFNTPQRSYKHAGEFLP